jgi:hypothetical protein
MSVARSATPKLFHSQLMKLLYYHVASLQHFRSFLTYKTLRAKELAMGSELHPCIARGQIAGAST